MQTKIRRGPPLPLPDLKRTFLVHSRCWTIWGTPDVTGTEKKRDREVALKARRAKGKAIINIEECPRPLRPTSGEHSMP
jgi:hypothetical protein